ncbi:hypothetical protein [Streptomyces mirabilis]|uniref:hypothetical protein n=1 Tax=Streptomyces mirabilis TaxID=68239 RepID=UPI0036C645A8
MLNNPPIRCPECQSFDLEAHLITHTGGGQDVSGFTCRACHFTWEPFEMPQFDGPNYATAYVGAPELVDEELALIILAEELRAQDTAALAGQRTKADPVEHRLFRLRQAAYLDRAARHIELGVYCGRFLEADGDHASTHAVRAASEFLSLDLKNGQDHVAGPIGPGSPEWDIAGGTRAYIRQEYKAWRDLVQEDTDRAEIFPHRGPDGDLYDGDGRAH